MSSVSLWQRLCEHAGLSEYEAKAYVSLIKEGSSGARRLSMACDVPRTKIYGTLKKLVEKGLVIEIPEDPKKFAPTPPINAFESFLQSFERKTKDLYMAVSSLEALFEKTKSMARPQRETVWILRGRAEILQKAREMLSRAEKTVNVVTTENGSILLYKACNKLLDRLVEKGVRVQVAVPIGSKNQNLVNELRYICEVKQLNVGSPILFISIDKHEFLLANLTPDDLNRISDNDTGMYSNSQFLYNLIPLLLPNHPAMINVFPT